MDIEWVYVIWEKRSEVKLLKKKKISRKSNMNELIIWIILKRLILISG